MKQHVRKIITQVCLDYVTLDDAISKLKEYCNDYKEYKNLRFELLPDRDD